MRRTKTPEKPRGCEGPDPLKQKKKKVSLENKMETQGTTAAGCHQIKQSENTSLLKNRLPMQREFKEDVFRKNGCADLINYQIIFNPF